MAKSRVTKTIVNPTSWQRFPIRGLSVVPSIVGATHRFAVRRCAVEIRLPPLPANKPKAAAAWWGNDEIFCSAYRHNRPTCFEVFSVDVAVRLNRSVRVLLDSSGGVRRDLRGEQYERLNRLASVADGLAREAIERWLAVLRWQSGKYWIALSDAPAAPTATSTRLVDGSTGERFFSSPIVVHGSVSSPMPRRVWTATGQALAKDVRPPLWFDFLFDGQRRLRVDDRRGGIICLAVACEMILRALIARHSSEPPNPTYVSLMNQVPVSRILNDWKHLGFWGPRWQRETDLRALRRLFELRNALMHRGQGTLDANECHKLSMAVRAFLMYASPRAASQL